MWQKRKYSYTVQKVMGCDIKKEKGEFNKHRKKSPSCSHVFVQLLWLSNINTDCFTIVEKSQITAQFQRTFTGINSELLLCVISLYPLNTNYACASPKMWISGFFNNYSGKYSIYFHSLRGDLNVSKHFRTYILRIMT